MFLRNPERQEDGMGREGRDYWEAQLSEYWDSGLTIQEYSELKELPYESTRRWIRVLEKARQDDASDPESLELVEVKPLQTDARNGSGIRLLVDGIEIAVGKGFNCSTLSEVLNLLKGRSCAASAVYYCSTPINLRKSFDGLAGAVEEYIKQEPESGHVFAFFRCNKKLVKLLQWEDGGFVIWMKRLDQGGFHIPQSADGRFELTSREFAAILSGIKPQHLYIISCLPENLRGSRDLACGKFRVSFPSSWKIPGKNIHCS